MVDAFTFYGPVLRLAPPEVAHELTVRALALGLAQPRAPRREPMLACRFFGKELANPFGMAAGFDKNAEVIGPLLRLGFGFVEVGTVTPRPQEGNPRPRLFRLRRERAAINRMGFNNDGLAPLLGRLGRARAELGAAAVVAVNIGKNKLTEDAAADYIEGLLAVSGLADFVVMNISSPNTPGLRALQDRAQLTELLTRVRRAGRELPVCPPLLVKIAPDLSPRDCEDIAEVAVTCGVDGLVVSNTTVQRPEGLFGRARHELGGLSGPPLFARSTAQLARMYRLTSGKLAFIGAGGVQSGADAYAKVRAGASLVELYTSMIYEGPRLIGRLQRELVECLRRDGFTSVQDAVGADHR